jgi:hypothetical protein
MKHKKNIYTTVTSGTLGAVQIRPVQSVDWDSGLGSVWVPNFKN